MEESSMSGGILFLQDNIYEFITAIDENSLDNDIYNCSKMLHQSRYLLSADLSDYYQYSAQSSLERLYSNLFSVYSDFRDYFSVPSYVHQAFVRRICSSYGWKSKIFKFSDNSTLFIILTANWLRVVDITEIVDLTSAIELAEKADDDIFSIVQEFSKTTPQNSQLFDNEYEDSKYNPRDYRFCLGHADSYPKWRVIATFGKDLDSLIVAIGYSDGFIEIIWLTEAEINANKLTGRIHIDTLNQKNRLKKQANSLTPIIDIAFIDICHILVSHYIGYVDLWMIDKNSDSIPIRLLKRFYTNCVITTALYVPHLNTLLIGTEGKFSEDHAKLYGLHLLKVGLLAPFIVNFTKSDFTKKSKTTRRKWINNLFRKNPRLGSVTESDCVIKMLLTTVKDSDDDRLLLQDQRLLMLHCSGLISVWILPPKEPLFVFPNSLDSFPTNLSCWTPKFETGSTLPLFAVMKDSGEFSILDLDQFHERKFDFTYVTQTSASQLEPKLQFMQNATLVESEGFDGVFILNWEQSPDSSISATPNTTSTVASNSLFMKTLYYFYYMANQSLDIIGIDAAPFLRPYTPAVIARELELRSKAYHEPRLIKYVATVLRICPTSPTGLLSRQLKIGDYKVAMKLAKKHNLNLELIFKHQWLSLFAENTAHNSSPQQVIEAIDSVLSNIQEFSASIIWVLRECMERLPNLNQEEWSTEEILIFVFNLLNHGVKILKNHNFGPKSQDAHATLNARFIELLDHVETVRIMKESCSNFSSSDILHSLTFLRNDSILSFALYCIHGSKYDYLRVLCDRYPREVRYNILGILSSLLETTSPKTYLKDLLFPILIKKPLKDRLEIPLSHKYMEKLILMHKYLSAKYLYFKEHKSLSAQELLDWAVIRADEIEIVSGSTLNAAELITECLEFCSESLTRLDVPHLVTDKVEFYSSIDRIRHLESDYKQLISLIYDAHPTYSKSRLFATKFKLCEKEDSSSRFDVMLDRITVSKFSLMTAEQKIELLMTLQFDPKTLNKTRFQMKKTITGNNDSANNIILNSVLQAFYKKILPFINNHSEESERKSMLLCSLKRFADFFQLDFHILLAEKLRKDILNKSEDDILLTKENFPELVFQLLFDYVPENQENSIQNFENYLQDLLRLLQYLKEMLTDGELLKKIITFKLCTQTALALCNLVERTDIDHGLKLPLGFQSVTDLYNVCQFASSKSIHSLILQWVHSASKLFKHLNQLSATTIVNNFTENILNNPLLKKIPSANTFLQSNQVSNRSTPASTRNSFIESVLTVFEYLFAKTDELLFEQTNENKTLDKFNLLIGYSLLSSSDEELIQLAGQKKNIKRPVLWLASIYMAIRNYTECIVPMATGNCNFLYAKLCLEHFESDINSFSFDSECSPYLEKLSIEKSILELWDYLILQASYIRNSKTESLLKASLFNDSLAKFRRIWDDHDEKLNLCNNYFNTLMMAIAINNCNSKTSSPIYINNILDTSYEKFSISREENELIFINSVCKLVQENYNLCQKSASSLKPIFKTLKEKILLLVQSNDKLTSGVLELLLLLAQGSKEFEGIEDFSLLYTLFGNRIDEKSFDVNVEELRLKILTRMTYGERDPEQIKAILYLMRKSRLKIFTNEPILYKSTNLNYYSNLGSVKKDSKGKNLDLSSRPGKFILKSMDQSKEPISNQDLAQLAIDFMDIEPQISVSLSFGTGFSSELWIDCYASSMAVLKGFEHERMRLSNICFAALTKQEFEKLNPLNLAEIIPITLSKIVLHNNTIKIWEERAKSSIVIKQLFEKDKDLDVELFESDTDYRMSTILGISMTDPNLGLKLAKIYNISPVAILMSRLRFLLSDAEINNQWEKKLIKFLEKLVSQLDQSKLLEEMHESLFDSITKCCIYRAEKVFKILKDQISIPGDENFNGIPFGVHIEAVQILNKNPSWIKKVPYIAFFTEELDCLAKDEFSVNTITEFLIKLQPFVPKLSEKSNFIQLKLASNFLDDLMNLDNENSLEYSTIFDRLQAILLTMKKDQMKHWLETYFLIEEYPMNINAYKFKLSFLKSFEEFINDDEISSLVSEYIDAYQNLEDNWNAHISKQFSPKCPIHLHNQWFTFVGRPISQETCSTFLQHSLFTVLRSTEKIPDKYELVIELSRRMIRIMFACTQVISNISYEIWILIYANMLENCLLAINEQHSLGCDHNSQYVIKFGEFCKKFHGLLRLSSQKMKFIQEPELILASLLAKTSLRRLFWRDLVHGLDLMDANERTTFVLNVCRHSLRFLQDSLPIPDSANTCNGYEIKDINKLDLKELFVELMPDNFEERNIEDHFDVVGHLIEIIEVLTDNPEISTQESMMCVQDLWTQWVNLLFERDEQFNQKSDFILSRWSKDIHPSDNYSLAVSKYLLNKNDKSSQAWDLILSCRDAEIFTELWKTFNPPDLYEPCKNSSLSFLCHNTEYLSMLHKTHKEIFVKIIRVSGMHIKEIQLTLPNILRSLKKQDLWLEAAYLMQKMDDTYSSFEETMIELQKM